MDNRSSKLGETSGGRHDSSELRLLQQYIISETNGFSMAGEIEDAERAIEIARDYADDECVGELGEVLNTNQESNIWIIEFRTHTYTDAYKHRVQISSTGNVFSHERIS